MNSLQYILQAKLAGPSSQAFVTDEKTIYFLFEKVIQEYYGAKGKTNCLPLSFKEGTLTVKVYKSLWQAEITLTKEDLRESLNKKIGDDLVKIIRIQRK